MLEIAFSLVGFAFAKGTIIGLSAVAISVLAVGFGVYGLAKLGGMAFRAATGTSNSNRVAWRGKSKEGRDDDSTPPLSVEKLMAENEELLSLEAAGVNAPVHEAADSASHEVPNRPKVLVVAHADGSSQALADALGETLPNCEVVRSEDAPWWEAPEMDDGGGPILLDDNQRLGLAMAIAESEGYAAVVLSASELENATVRTPDYTVVTYDAGECAADARAVANGVREKLASARGVFDVVGELAAERESVAKPHTPLTLVTSEGIVR